MSLRKRMEVLLGGESYSKTSARKMIKGILNKYPLGTFLIGAELGIIKEVVGLHPESDEKVGTGISAIQIVKEDFYGHRRFDLVRNDGSRMDFSYIKCIQSDNLHFKDVTKAFRFAIINQIWDFKNSQYRNQEYFRCAITNLNVGKKDCHIDHAPPLTFESLLFDFMKGEGLTFDGIRVKDTAHVACVALEDELISNRWQDYHRANAVLRVTLDHANLGQKKVKVDWTQLERRLSNENGRL